MESLPATEDVGALWHSTLQRAVSRAAHDVKDALNGVSVNLEVIRSRAARPELPASALVPFGEAAGQQLERLTILIEAVLALSRAERTPADVAPALRRIAALCGASASHADALVHVMDDGSAGSTITVVRGDVVCLALAAPLLEFTTGTDRKQRASDVTCRLGGSDDAVVVVLAADGRRAVMPEYAADAVRSAGVRIIEGTQDLSLAFPRP